MYRFKVYVICDIMNQPVVLFGGMCVYTDRDQAEIAIEHIRCMHSEVSHISETEITLPEYVVN